jgi:ribosomal protein S18 acetylase RimI-like enzyme
MDITIQLASKDDLSELLPLVRAYHEFEGIILTESNRKKSVQGLICNRSLGGIWLVCVDTKLVGYIALCSGYSIEFGGLDAFVDEFYISADYRGKGIGGKVLELIKKKAQMMDIRALHLEVSRSNTKAQTLYSKASFKAREKYLLMSVNL